MSHIHAGQHVLSTEVNVSSTYAYLLSIISVVVTSVCRPAVIQITQDEADKTNIYYIHTSISCRCFNNIFTFSHYLIAAVPSQSSSRPWTTTPVHSTGLHPVYFYISVYGAICRTGVKGDIMWWTEPVAKTKTKHLSLTEFYYTVNEINSW